MQYIQHKEISQHAMAVYALCAKDEHSFFSGGSDKVVALWDVRTGKQFPFAIQTSASIYSLAYSTEHDRIFIGLSNGDFHWVDVGKKQEVKFFKTGKEAIFSQIALNRDGLLITGDAGGFLRVWNVAQGKLLLTIPLNCGKIRALALNHDETLLAIGAQDGKIYLVETTYFNPVNNFFAHQDGCNSLRFFPKESNQLISGGKDGYIRVWNIKNGTKLQAIPAHNYAVYQLLFSEDGKNIYTCSRDKSIKIWDTVSLSVLQKIDTKAKGHRHSVNALLLLNDTLISSSDDKRILIWERV